MDELGLRFQTRRRRISSYTPVPGTDTAVLIDTADAERTRASLERATGDAAAFGAWQAFYDQAARVARAVFPTMLEPLASRDELRRRIGDDAAWEALFERPIGEAVEAAFADDVVRGIALTDALIGTFASAREESLRQNRCFLYHVIGNGTGAWDVPVGGMGALTGELAACAASAGAELATGVEVTAIEADGRRAVGALRERRGRGLGDVRARDRGLRAGRARPAARLTAGGDGAGGRAAEGEHAAEPPAAPARERRGARGRVRRDVPRQRDVHAARVGVRAGAGRPRARRRCRARSTATR